MKLSFSLNKKRLIAAVLLMLAAVMLCLVFRETIKFTLVIALLFLAGGFLDVRIFGRLRVLVLPLFALAAALLTVLLAQEANELRSVLPPRLLILGTGCALLLILLLHSVFVLFFKCDMRVSVIAATGALLFLSIVNYYTYSERGTGLSPSDLLSTATAFNIVGHYTLSLTQHILIAVLLYLACVFLLLGIHVEDPPKLGLRWIGGLASALALALCLYFTLGDPHSWMWQNAGTERNGFILNFFTEIRESIITPPKNYGAGAVEAVEERYEGDTKALSETPPHIIVIMCEAYTDLRVIGDLQTDVPFMPFVDSLTENVIKGYALSSVYGGMTPNSEYEFLTGNTMGLLQPFSIPYMQLMHTKTWSLNAWLESLGYSSFSSHPAAGINWRREDVYPLFGFERSEFEQDYPDPHYLRNFVRDDDLVDHIIRQLETEAGNGPQFLFTVTLQNHGGYYQDYVFEEPVHVIGSEHRDAEVFLSCMLASDRAFQRLATYLESRDDHVLVLLFGDHQPALSTEFLEQLHGGSFDTLDEQMLLNQVPFLLWANYDIQEATLGLSSLNYLPTLLLETAGLPLSPYHQFLRDTQAVIPAINAFCYRTADGRTLPIGDSDEAEKAALYDYSVLQYNAIFDRRGRSTLFFPAPD